jgi:hypothetical protein
MTSSDRKNPYELMLQLKAEEPPVKHKLTQQPYDSVASKKALRKNLKAKHNARSAG